MKCRVCGTEIEGQIYCPMCGAAVNPEQGIEEEREEVPTDAVYQYHGIDADATTVLAGNNIINESESEESSEEESCVVSGEAELPRKSHKKLILVLGITVVVLLITGFSIFCYFHYIYPNKITYMGKSVYFETEEKIGNSEGLNIAVSDKNRSRTLLQADYNKNVFLYMGTDGKRLEQIDERGKTKTSEEKKIVSVIADDNLSKVYYWTQEKENAYSLRCLGEKDVVKRYVTGVNGTVISQNGEYLAYSYKAEEDAYVVCMVMPSGEVNQIAALEHPARVLGVTEEGKVFCELQNPVNEKAEDEGKPEVTYTVYCVQDKKNYGSDLRQVEYFGYYSKLEAFVMQTADKSVYYIDMKNEGKEKLVATNVDWFTDISEACKYQQSCDREKILGGSKPGTLKNGQPCYYYLKENNLYRYNILEDNESQKVAAGFGRAREIELWNDELIFYLAGENLYSCEKSEEGWQEPKLLAKKCVEYQYVPKQKCVYYLADETLYSYQDGKEEKISDKVKSFDLNPEEGKAAYSTDTSIVIYQKEAEEYAVKSEGKIFLTENDVYYMDAQKMLYQLSVETGEIKETAGRVEEVRYIWK